MTPVDPRLVALRRIDGELTRAGWHPMTGWWKREAQRASEHPTARTWVASVGRGGIKSGMGVRLALAEVLGGAWQVPPGERHYFAFVSVSKDEAAGRLTMLEAALRALGVPFHRAGDCIDLDALPLGFKVLGCQVAAVSGFRCIGAFLDEVAKWQAAEGSANPAAEVVASIRAMTVTHPAARVVAFSSPLIREGWHHEAVERGDDARQVVSRAPTWVANPSITEQQTRELEPDPRVWRREYAAEASDAVAAAFDGGVDHCVARGVRRRAPIPGGRHGVALDVGLRHDRTAILAFHVELRSRDAAPPLRHLVVDAVEWLKPALLGLRHVQMSDVEERVVSLCREYGVTRVVSDSREAASLGERLRARGIALAEMGMAPSYQEKRAAALVGHVGAGTLDLIDDRDLVAEMNQAETVLSGGRWLISAPRRRSAHDDGLDALLLACEVCQSLPPSGGDITCEERIRWQPELGGLHVDRTWRRRLENGSYAPCEPPAGTIDAEQAREARFRQGLVTPGDLADLGEDEVARRIAAGGGGDVDPGQYGHDGPQVALPPDPGVERIGGWGRY